MRKRLLIATGAILTILVAAAVGLYVYDRSGKDTIAKGIHIAGVDVGGMSEDRARDTLEAQYMAKLRQPIVVNHGNKQFRLTAKESKVAANVDTLVDQALAASRDPGIFSRTWRRLTGGTLDEDLTPEATFDKDAAIRLVDRVRKSIDRDAVNAKMEIALGGPKTTPSRDGLEVKASELHAQIRKAIVDPSADHTLVAHTEKTTPKVTTESLAAEYPAILVVNREKFQLTLYRGLKKKKTYSVAIGAVGRDTPEGLYHIENKAVNPAWTKPHSDWIAEDERGDVVPGGDPGNPLKARWLGIFDGAGIHGVDPSEYGSIGHAASHGCVRMRIPDVIELYPQVPVGAPILIA